MRDGVPVDGCTRCEQALRVPELPGPFAINCDWIKSIVAK